MSENQDKLYKQAKKRVLYKMAFYWHLGSYVAVGTFFFLLNYFTGFEKLWWYFPMIPWALGLTMHYMAVFGLPFTKGVLTKEWREKEIANEMDRLNDKYRPETLDDFGETEGLELKELQKRKNYRDGDFV